MTYLLKDRYYIPMVKSINSANYLRRYNRCQNHSELKDLLAAADQKIFEPEDVVDEDIFSKLSEHFSI